MISAKGYVDEKYLSYATTGIFRIKLAKAYNERFGELYEKYIQSGFSFGEKLTEEEQQEWKDILSKDKYTATIHKFFTCPDCDASFSPRECEKLLVSFKNVKLDYVIDDRFTSEEFNVLDYVKELFEFCGEQKVKLLFF